MKRAYLVLLLSTTYLSTLAQLDERRDTASQVVKETLPKSFSVNLSLFNHSISTPFHKIISTPIHPGVQAGVEGRYFQTISSKLFQTLNLGMFNNNYNGAGFYLNTELGYRYTSRVGVFAEVLVGIGYLRVYHPVDIYELTNSGVYQKAKDKGFSSALVSFAFGLGYVIKSSSPFAFSPFLRYESLIQTNYTPELGVLPQSALHVGVRVQRQMSK
jgi:hypothetical protein